jgi:histidine ammonia-lyase
MSQIVFPERGEIISAGNFHGEYPAKVLDYLAVAVHELASMSERRTERLVNPGKSFICDTDRQNICIFHANCHV